MESNLRKKVEKGSAERLYAELRDSLAARAAHGDVLAPRGLSAGALATSSNSVSSRRRPGFIANVRSTNPFRHALFGPSRRMRQNSPRWPGPTLPDRREERDVRAASVQDFARSAGAIGRENRQAAGERFQQDTREPSFFDGRQNRFACR